MMVFLRRLVVVIVGGDNDALLPEFADSTTRKE